MLPAQFMRAMGNLHNLSELRGSPSSLPAHARIIANEHVWLESTAIDQLARAARQLDCSLAVGMPDMHPGPNSPIGAVLGYRNTIIPPLIGGDAGCGARLMVTKERRYNLEKIERRLENHEGQAWRDDVDCAKLLAAVWRDGVAGIAKVDGVPERLALLAAQDPDSSTRSLGVSSDLPSWCEPEFARQLGSVGAGNHFLEITRVAGLSDVALARGLSLELGAVAVLAHTGSRALGKFFAQEWQGRRLEAPDEQKLFIAELAGVLRFASANRFLCAYEGLVALGETRASKLACVVDLCHNDVRLETVDNVATWIHRKGAAPAYADAPTLLLGSRGVASWLLWGQGCAHSASSVAHGAGRTMTRAEAREKIRHKYKRSQLQRTALGGRVLYGNNDLLLEEHPDAYKDVEPVVDSLEAVGAAKRVASLHPLITIKR